MLQATGAQPSPESGPIRVVIVDDHAVFADALALLLDREPRVEVVGVAASALEGVDLAVGCEADVVLMDVGLPRIDGLEGTRRLRKLRPEASVIILSGFDRDELRAEAERAGAAEVLTKGFIHDTVVDAILDSVRGDNADDLSGRDGLTDRN